MSKPLDNRRHAYRKDLASSSLQGIVEAPRFVTGTLYQAVHSVLPLRGEPDPAAHVQTQMLFGELITVYDTANGWAWGQLERDDYVGYVVADMLSATVVDGTHCVSALGTFVYPRADIKSPPMLHLSLNAQLAVAETDKDMSRLATGGYVVNRHIVQQNRPARDYVDVAERFLGVPYLWGGRSSLGVDCSGLVQLAMQRAGLVAPRDSDMQEAEIGESVLVPKSLEGLQRGDLVFWKGHVGIMVDGVMLLHANAYHMAVVIEPLSTTVARIARNGQQITSIKRPVGLTG